MKAVDITNTMSVLFCKKQIPFVGVEDVDRRGPRALCERRDGPSCEDGSHEGADRPPHQTL